MPRSHLTQDELRERMARKARTAAARSCTPRGRYKVHRHNAARRGIEFSLSFAQWWGIWKRSGRWNERGRGRGRYVMARKGDAGPYAVGNVKIIRNEENGAEHQYSAEERTRMARARRDQPRNLRGQYVAEVVSRYARAAARRMMEVQHAP